MYDNLVSLRPPTEGDDLETAGGDKDIMRFCVDLALSLEGSPAVGTSNDDAKRFATGVYTGIMYGLVYVREFGIPNVAKKVFTVGQPNDW